MSARLRKRLNYCVAANDARGQRETNGSAAKRDLFDHLVGNGEQSGRESEAERLCSLKIDHKFELGWFQDRQVGRFLTFQNFARKNSHLTILLSNIDAIAHQPSGRRKFSNAVNSGNRIPRSQRHQFSAPSYIERLSDDHKCNWLLLAKVRKGNINTLLIGGLEDDEFVAAIMRRILDCCCDPFSRRVIRINKHCKYAGIRHSIVQQAKPLRVDCGRKIGDAGCVSTGPAKALDQTRLNRVLGHIEYYWNYRAGRFGREG